MFTQYINPNSGHTFVSTILSQKRIYSPTKQPLDIIILFATPHPSDPKGSLIPGWCETEIPGDSVEVFYIGVNTHKCLFVL